MPCYQVNTISVEFKVKHSDLLRQAIEALGWKMVAIAGGSKKPTRLSVQYSGYRSLTINMQTGTATFNEGQGGQKALNKLKKEYSKQAIFKVAKQKKWIVKSKAGNKFTLTKY